MRYSGGFVVLLLSELFGGCTPHYEELPTFSAERKLLQVVVEMPAGTNHARHYDPTSHDFVSVRRAGLDLVVEFLPCPGNQGFIPGTRLGAAARPLSALVLAETQPASTILEVVPIGMLTLDDNGVLKPIILAVPARPSQQILPDVVTWQALISRYPGAREVIRQWFLHQGRPNEIRIASWKDEKAAEKQVKEAMN
ncbi:inorganic diphosphatase [uncultured Hymenobacter sp.]|uniref:inorganic diphosphatase n=1 Tax=uncultured Hymenobacter sp. TaxID=170016 RepID=UPI0035C9B20C